MNAVQVLRDRIGFGWRLRRAATDARDAALAGSSLVARVAGGVAEITEAPAGRTETLFRRQVKNHGRVRAVLEIGQPGMRHEQWLDGDIRHDGIDVSVDRVPADVASVLREIPAGSYDAVFSVDALEFVKAPWRAADEIVRILRPGGITFHTTVFTTRYQPQPEDFFRFTPDGLKSLFSDLDCVAAEFDATARKRPQRRFERRDPTDIFGGSREGWRVHYCGRKPLLR